MKIVSECFSRIFVDIIHESKVLNESINSNKGKDHKNDQVYVTIR